MPGQRGDIEDSDDEVLPYRGEGSTRNDGVNSDLPTLRRIAITAQHSSPNLAPVVAD